MATSTAVKTVTVDSGVEVFYREAHPASAKDIGALPVLLLLHGFPSSSFQYRNLIPRLATKYRVIAPDFPGYGFTVVPEARKYEYTFVSLANTTAAFVDALGIKKFGMYVFDYGAPTGFRLALQRPDAVTAIISQNGNAYEDGFGEQFWAPIKAVWADPSAANLQKLAGLSSFETTKFQYVDGAPNASVIPPETFNLDYYLMTRPGNGEVQLKYIIDYKTNVPLYPRFHEYFRERRPPILAIWGKNDTIFVPPGADAFKRDQPDAVVKFVDGGHFALESALDEIASEILAFLAKNGI
ncbi:alpha/beta hydrolase fold protein [Epithele typhae]|uniref:alpha/beta hydrolase fold protein n=1 Tax=Epithele typhae TaxID=378194 RepID=UPI002008072C|nr:alpha/beta hydrolase fold protein [Epithele typhae]KAH9932022.1 alpha/beta hydrolase fold protein [Epithele typhae]